VLTEKVQGYVRPIKNIYDMLGKLVVSSPNLRYHLVELGISKDGKPLALEYAQAIRNEFVEKPFNVKLRDYVFYLDVKTPEVNG
jgi:hypothetical protein